MHTAWRFASRQFSNCGASPPRMSAAKPPASGGEISQPSCWSGMLVRASMGWYESWGADWYLIKLYQLGRPRPNLPWIEATARMGGVSQQRRWRRSADFPGEIKGAAGASWRSGESACEAALDPDPTNPNARSALDHSAGQPLRAVLHCDIACPMRLALIMSPKYVFGWGNIRCCAWSGPVSWALCFIVQPARKRPSQAILARRW